jgi:hypothetical protein
MSPRLEALLDRHRHIIEPALAPVCFIGYALMAWGLARMLGVL